MTPEIKKVLIYLYTLSVKSKRRKIITKECGTRVVKYNA